MRKKIRYDRCKQFPAFIIVLFLLSCSRSDRPKTELEKECESALLNRIKKITITKTDYLSGLQQREEMSQEKIFDEKGFKIKEVNYGNEGEFVCKISQQYSPSGNPTVKTGLNPDNSLLFRETISYDEHDNRKEFYFYLPDGTYKYRNTAVVDKRGRIIQLTWFWPDGIKAINKYVFDGDKVTEDVEYDPKGNFRYRWHHRYDRSGHLIQSVQYYPNNKVNARTDNQYEGDELVGQINYIGESIQNRIKYEYDSKHLLIQKTEFSPAGSISSRFKYRYEFF